ncbi:BirA family biotin operon repressor/biotin-[acetyl-CoA-carboxylase] ligase [Rhabdobacter roseus]|uniref:BirA family biotin operon repressor/biotin-[acetyl-CoA-carboxylase] ligase n=1 Tax=Rhabdobacter roseus TaxID=1655419 RepID=A0A840THS9_9BACT|nr:biotin--[acetyl-CoA-carboxylase] ligase [Rhabdobacter roseus]MBB5282831.1 BirA family biotin operon repressor/biotin-[acetyl-CoA-carboxylase] ligase [Rhabdobacter roseus]
MFLGKKILYLPTCHSTNDIAAEIVRDATYPEGTLIITDQQTAGRGQRGHAWVTSQGQNFTLSLLLKPTFLRPEASFLLSQAVALGVRNYLQRYLKSVWVKWPNDIYIHDYKAGGILIENTWQGSRLTHSVVGIGLNINQSTFEAPRATSLRLETGQLWSLPAELPWLLQSLEQYYLRLRNGAEAAIREEYMSCLLGYQQARAFRAGDEVLTGTIVGVSTAGRLRVEVVPEGRIREFEVKTIEWIWPAD